jgi:lysozyme
MTNLKTSETGLSLIKHYEGCRLVGYLDAVNIPTIGYGHTGLINNKQIYPGITTLSQQEANTLLANDLKSCENCVNQYIEVPLNQHQFDALVSLAFNIGSGNFSKSSLAKAINNKEVDASTKFNLWVYGNKKVLPGLIKRRLTEKILYDKGVLIF